MKKTYITVPLVVTLALSILLGQLMLNCTSYVGPVSGAIFTTDETGLLVDGNIYADGMDVYLSGGPGPNAPPDAAGLPDGEYYFQVTDPAGKKLLSTDDIKERRFEVEGGIITQYLGTPATHNWEVVEEISGAIVIQLWPFGKTPNKGGVYKAWATPVEDYDLNNRKSFFGFIPQYSKTDNYKVRKPKPITKLTLDKFYDVNNNGIYDNGDYLMEGWRIDVTGPLGVTNPYYTPEVIDVIGPPGTYIVTEELPAGWEQTAVAVDGIYMPVDVTVTVEIENGETHSVLYGNRETTPPTPPRIKIGLGIYPIIQRVGSDITFSWTIDSPSEATPVKVELKLTDPDGAETLLYWSTTFPDDFTGSKTWTATGPTGYWTVLVKYYYTYRGSDLTAKTSGEFIVHTSDSN